MIDALRRVVDAARLSGCLGVIADFEVTKAYARELKEKLEVFEARTKTKKAVHVTLVTPHGLKRNTWSEALIQSQVTLSDLFR